MRRRLDPVRIGKNVRAIREGTGLSQHDFGARLGRSANYIWRIERGQRKPGPALYGPLASMGKTTVDELLYGTVERLEQTPPSLWLSFERDLSLDDDIQKRVDRVEEEVAAINREIARRRRGSRD